MMTTNDETTLDHMNASLDTDLQQLNIAPSAADGTGLNYSSCRDEETEYVKKILDKEIKLENSFRINKPYLAVITYREEILQQLEINPVVLIQGPTGCGKTTQIPQYILDYHQSKGSYCNIIVTQPRKIAALSIARRVCEERKCSLGSIVGYQVAINSKISPDTRINYMTTGVLLEKLVNEKKMDMFTHVIIDEVHERDQETDFALLLVKKFLNTNSQRVKVILMSATFDSSEFVKYFSSSSHDNSVAVVEIKGKSRDVMEHYLLDLKSFFKKIPEFDILKPNIDPCLYDGVVNLICDFDRIEKVEQRVSSHNAYVPSRRAVLVFLPGYEEIHILSNKLQAANFNKKFWIIPLHSSISVEEQAKVFRSPIDMRKVILSTNIAESSITVPDLKYVIDFCLAKNLVTDSLSNYSCLQLEWASKANCIQRKGRVGRVDIGKVYRMVPLEFYNSLLEYNIPEMKRCPLTKTILQIKKLDLCKPREMLSYALDPPTLSDIGSAILQLKEGLALTLKSSNPFDGDLTFIGRVMANLPLDIKLSKLILFGYVFHCLEECIIIAASLSLQNFFAQTSRQTLNCYRSRLSWTDNTFSDCLCFLNAFKMWKLLSMQGEFKRPGGISEYQWAKSHLIQMKKIKEVDLLVKDIKDRLGKHHIFAHSHHQFKNADESNIVLKIIIAGAFFPYYYVQQPLDEKEIHRSMNENDPLSSVLISGIPSKHNILYATALKEMFACCSENISIEFEESRGYVRFLSNYEKKASLVHPAVYTAIKMRKLRIPLELPVFSHEEAEIKTKQLLSSKRKSSNLLVSKRATVSEMSTLKRMALPALDISLTQIFITWINNCGHFWARYLTSEVSNLLYVVETTINKGEGRNLEPLTTLPRMNLLYLAPYVCGNDKPLYHRVQVQEIKSSEVTVLNVDFGSASTIHISELREIPKSTPNVVNTPALAFECHLAKIKPSSSSGNWSEEANMWFKKLVNGKVIYAKIYSVIHGTVRMELLKHDLYGPGENINQQLIKLEFAEPAEESFVSKQNNELRLNAINYSRDGNFLESSSRHIEFSWNETEAHDIEKTGGKIRLHGPFNPLESSFSGLTKFDRYKCIKLECDSVNSVSFNAEPQHPYSRMLIASNVTVSQKNLELILRNTTLLPKIRGLPALICLLFSPYAEIRTDKRRTSYTGALFGLGFHSLTGEPIFSDHDIELAFDVDITLDDIKEINAIRMGFNLLFSSENDDVRYASNTVNFIHKRTLKTIIDLLKKKRSPREPVYFDKEYEWNEIAPELLLEASIESNAKITDVLPLHKPASLTTFEIDNLSQNL